jgi:hypothetical protein
MESREKKAEGRRGVGGETVVGKGQAGSEWNRAFLGQKG